MVNTGGYNEIYGSNKGFSTLKEEKDAVKRALQVEPTERSLWQPIGMSWFINWKNYVNFDDAIPEPRDPKEVENFHPGPIDNAGLKGSYGDELRRDIVEGQDYVLLPKVTADRLFTKYSGGPQFPREAINVGSFYAPLIQINLFPVRLEMYHCDRKHPSPTKDLKSHFMIRDYTKTLLLENIFDDLKIKFSIDYLHDVRCWMRDPEHKRLALTGNNNEEKEEEGESNKKPRAVGRMLTADQVEWDGDWRYMPKLNKSLQDLLGTKECIEIIIESTPSRSKDADWPRFALLQSWKNHLKVGDLIDAQDRSKHWYEAVIKDIDATGKVHVHFKGWGTEFDEIILPDQRVSRIKPLHSESEDRSTWEEGDSIELNISSPGQQPIWLPVTIVGQNLQTDQILVQYSSKSKHDNLKKLLGKTQKKETVTDDDVLKKKKPVTSSSSMMETDGDSTDAEEEGTGSGGAEAKEEEPEVVVKDEMIKEWHDLYGDSICALYTHTDKPKQTSSSYSSLYNYNYSSTGYGSTSRYGSGARSYYDSYDRNTKGTPVVNGAVGLQNLGNTCFMNSIIQCLSNTELLCSLFTNGNYKDQINYDNPLGHNGKVALSYGKLMKEIWSNAYTLVVPREFKNTIGEFRPQFAGTEQQDSQEFMNFLLDGLHEDLNRIQKKPHVQKIESKGRDDSLISSESWRRFLLRNDSELVNHFFGQLKSHVTCVNCGNVSVTFDEYSSLSLPIPVRNTKSFTIFVQLLPIGSVPLRVTIEVEITAPMSQLKKILVDRLIELGVILETSNSLSASPVPTPLPHQKAAQTEGEKEEGGFEMIRADEAMMEVVEGEEEAVKRSSTSPPPPLPPSAGVKYDNYHFHFATLFGSRPSSVFKNYNGGETGATAIQAFIGKLDTLIAFQLEHDVPDFKGTTYSYSSSYYNKSYNSSNSETPVAKATAIDIVTGMKSNYGRIELLGYPNRFSVSKEGGVTNHDIHLLVRQYLRRFLSEEISENNNSLWPFDLLVMNSYATNIKREVEDNNSPFDFPTEGSDLLVVCWTAAAINEKMVDLDQLKLIRDPLTNEKVSTSEKKTKTNTSYSLYDIDEDEEETRKDKKLITIYDCLDKFIEREQLNETETLYCPACKQHLAPIKKMDIYSAPDILIIHLKRFQFIPGQYFVHREKINDLIDFPLTGLDLTKYVRGRQVEEAPPIYDLYGVSHHMGGLGGGHYVATCKNYLNNTWYKFNDSVVSETSESSIVSGTAYVLFYKRRSGSLPWGGIIPNPNPLPDED